MSNVKYPNVTVFGSEENAFALLGKVHQGLRNAGATPTEIDEFFQEATSSDYQNLVEVCLRWVDVREG